MSSSNTHCPDNDKIIGLLDDDYCWKVHYVAKTILSKPHEHIHLFLITFSFFGTIKIYGK